MKQVNYVPGVIPYEDVTPMPPRELAYSPSCVSKWAGKRLHDDTLPAASTSQTMGYIA